MTQVLKSTVALVAVLAICSPMLAQESPAEPEDQAPPTAQPSATAQPSLDTVEGVVEQVDQNEQAQDVKSNILAPIYALAESFSFPAFHWLAFALMVTGVVSFALQLVLGKLVVLSKFSFSLTEILSDTLGLMVSVLGLVLTTQAATENSSFTTSASSVISATVVGVLLGMVFYVWGQRQELEAVEGRRRVARSKTPTTDQRTSS